MMQRDRVLYSCLYYKCDKVLHLWKQIEKSLCAFSFAGLSLIDK